MTKEQVQQHGDVIKWLCDNPDKGVWYKWENILGTKWEHSTILRFEADDCEGGEIVSIIPNDEYAEFRKALVEGKTVQCRNLMGGYWSNLSKSNDFWQNFKGESKYYRVKPEEPKFKVGDCVKIKDSYELLPHQKRIFVVDFIDDYNNLFGTNKNTEYSNANYCELWEPKVGEWCWFWNKGDELPLLGKFNTITNGLFTSSNTYYLEDIPWCDFPETEANYDFYCCEPFIGELPSFLKEQ